MKRGCYDVKEDGKKEGSRRLDVGDNLEKAGYNSLTSSQEIYDLKQRRPFSGSLLVQKITNGSEGGQREHDYEECYE